MEERENESMRDWDSMSPTSVEASVVGAVEKREERLML